MNETTYTLAELDRETRMGGAGKETADREIRRIDLSDFDRRRASGGEGSQEPFTQHGAGHRYVDARGRHPPGPRPAGSGRQWPARR
jgi:hypothetical protein